MRIKIKYGNSPRYFWTYLLIIISCFFPAYLYGSNEQNLIFAMAEIPLFAFVLLNSKYFIKKRKQHNIFLLVIILYFLTFLYINVLYLDCYWPMFYKTGAFLFIWILLQYDSKEKRNCTFFVTISTWVIALFTISVIVSLVGYVVGLDAVHLNLANISLRAQGIYADSRLTWLFMHKSTYGLLTVSVLGLIIQRRNLPYRKLLIVFYLITLLFINSAVSIAAALIVILSSCIKAESVSVKFMIKMIFLICAGLVGAAILYYYIAANRDLSSIGSRLYIWAKVPELFMTYPHGMGSLFYSVRIWVEDAGFSINNLHNVFLNESLHYSIPVGILYVIELLYVPACFVKKTKNKFSSIILIIGLVMPMMFDQALNDIVLPFYLLVLLLNFINFEVKKEGDLKDIE